MADVTYLEVAIKITPFSEESADIVVATIEEAGFESFVTESPYLKAYIKKELFSQPRLRSLLSFFDNNNGLSLEVTINPVKQENWNKVWESGFSPITIDGGRCIIKASFHKNLPPSPYTITIDPKMAFGTGHHQTTTLMAKWLLRLADKRAAMLGRKEPTLKGLQILDMGTGTGILAILAAKLGSLRPLHAIDIDIVAVNSAKENIYKNRLHRAITVLLGDSSLIQASRYDIILANINRNILLSDMPTYARGLRSAAQTRFLNRDKRGYRALSPEFSHGGILIVSGFYKEDLPMLKARAKEYGLKFISFMQRQNWVAACFVAL